MFWGKKLSKGFVIIEIDKLRNLCEKVVIIFQNQNNPEFSEIISNLQWVINSYNFDRNPIGLIEYSEKALKILKEYFIDKSNKTEKYLIKQLDACLKGSKIIDDNFPVEILKQGKDVIKRYNEQIENQGKDSIYEAKIMLVGEPGSGKTSLMNKLFDKNYQVPNNELKSTLGIEVRQNLEFSFNDKPNIKAHIWDFGGQQIQYMLHQFFLTSDCLYVLMAEKRKELANFDYWLNIISILGKNSPVIILFNEINIDTASSFIYDEKKYKELYPALNLHKLDINLANLKDGRFDVLVNTIKEKLACLEVIGKEVPAKWVDIRRELEALKKKKHITIGEYFDVCSKYGIANEDDGLLILRYFHLLGIVLNFSEDQNLCDTIFLDPNWTVDAVYSVLTDEKIENNYGIFDKNKVDTIWIAKGYGYEERIKLMQLMLKDNFDLCYKLPGNSDTFIVPLLLFKAKPEYTWNNTGNLVFRFQYPFMPKGIVSRLIVRLNMHIEKCDKDKMPLIWKEGAIFNKNGARAQVIESQTSKEGLKIIEIRLTGHPNYRIAFLTLLREEIKKIQDNSFPNLPYNEMVPCNCMECSLIEEPEFFNYRDLDNLMLKNKKEIQCRKSGDMVNILGLIDTVFDKNKNDKEDLSMEQQIKSIQVNGGQNIIISDTKDSNIDIHDIRFFQEKWDALQPNIDLAKLEEELKLLRESLIKEATASEHYSSITDIARAEEEVKKKNGPKAMEFLKKTGKWTFDVATKIGTTVAAEAIKKALGINP